jgi:hypothetical protein
MISGFSSRQEITIVVLYFVDDITLDMNPSLQGLPVKSDHGGEAFD